MLGKDVESSKVLLKERLAMSDENKITLYRIMGLMTYLNATSHTFNMDKGVDPYDLLVISFRYVTMVDHDGLRFLVGFMEELESRDIRVVLIGMKPFLIAKIKTISGMEDEFAKRTWEKILTKKKKRKAQPIALAEIPAKSVPEVVKQ